MSTLNITHVLSRYLFLLVAVTAASSNPGAPDKDSQQDGIIVLGKDQLKNQSIPLNARWEFYANQLIGTAEMKITPANSFREVPFWWVEESGKPSVQYATYRLRVVLSETDQQDSLALSMPDLYCSYDLWVNGHKLGGNGIVAQTKSEAKPQWKPETYAFRSETDTLDIIVHLSNFYHHRTGISKAIVLGYATPLIRSKNRLETANVILLSGIACLALAALFYFLKIKKIALLFYVLLCLAWMFRSAFSNHYQIVQWFPDINWYLCVRVEYISIYLSTLFGSLLVGSLFPRDVNKAFRLFFIITCAGFTLFTLLAPPMLFTQFVQLYLGLSSILLGSIVVIIIKAYSESREGAGLLLITTMLGVGIFGYVILSYQGVFQLDEMIFNIGFLIQFILTLATVIRRIRKMETTQDYDMMTFDQATNKKI